MSLIGNLTMLPLAVTKWCEDGRSKRWRKWHWQKAWCAQFAHMKRSHSQILILSSKWELPSWKTKSRSCISPKNVCTSYVNNFHLDMSIPKRDFTSVSWFLVNVWLSKFQTSKFNCLNSCIQWHSCEPDGNTWLYNQISRPPIHNCAAAIFLSFVTEDIAYKIMHNEYNKNTWTISIQLCILNHVEGCFLTIMVPRIKV